MPKLGRFELYALAAAVAAYALYRGAGAVIAAADAVNPFNNDNVISQGANSVYRGITGDEGTIGTGIYDVTHDGTFNPTSTNNILYPHNERWSLGTQIYDWMH